MPTLMINGQPHSVDVDADTPLLWVLRDILGLNAAKFGCGIAQCGACTVYVDGKAVRACNLPVGLVGERAITTPEGLDMADPIVRAIKSAWVELDVVQCGYCQPGQVMAAWPCYAPPPNPRMNR